MRGDASRPPRADATSTWWRADHAVEDCPFDADHATCGTAACLRTGLAGWPLGLGYIVDLFRNKVERYVRRLVGKTRPRKVLVCMIYYLDEAPLPTTTRATSYSSTPARPRSPRRSRALRTAGPTLPCAASATTGRPPPTERLPAVDPPFTPLAVDRRPAGCSK